MLELYKNIKKFRTERKMTQTELAEKAGYADKSMIAKIEKGLIDLPQTKIMLFADIFNVDAGLLMGSDGIKEEQPSYYNDPEVRELAEFMHKNPEYKVLFDASKNVKKEDIEFVKQMIDRMRGGTDDTGC